MRKLAIGLVLVMVVIFTLLVNSYNTIQKNDELVSAAASELLNQYQRRFDLILIWSVQLRDIQVMKAMCYKKL